MSVTVVSLRSASSVSAARVSSLMRTLNRVLVMCRSYTRPSDVDSLAVDLTRHLSDQVRVVLVLAVGGVGAPGELELTRGHHLTTSGVAVIRPLRAPHSHPTDDESDESSHQQSEPGDESLLSL